MKKNFFFEMDVDDDMPSGEGSMDFDFDSDTPESSSDDQSMDDTPTSAEEDSSTNESEGIDVMSKLPDSYKTWLDKQSDGESQPLYNIDGFKTAVKLFNNNDVQERFKQDCEIRSGYEGKNHFPEVFVAVGESPFGDSLIINTITGKVSVWEHETCDQIPVAGSWDEFIGKIHESTGDDKVTQEAFGPDDYRTYIDDYLKEIEPLAADDPIYQLELLIHDKLPKDFAEGICVFDDNRFNNVEIKKDGEVIFVVSSMWSLKEIVFNRENDNSLLHDDSIFAIGEDGYGNFIVMRTTDDTYHAWYHDKWDGDKNLMIHLTDAFSSENEFGAESNLLKLLGDTTIEDTSIDTPESPDTDDTATGDEDTQEQPTKTLFGESFHNVSRFDNKIYQEADEPEELTDEDFEIPKLDDSDDNKEVSDDESNKEKEVPEKETPDGDDLSSFGTDTSTEQNEYDPEEIKILNEMIGDEQFAMTRYFDAAKNTNVEVLRRLYSDIGAEESFHSEQLLYAKSTITGETYRPRNEDVKKEYEELLAMGMDEETAASTAIDKAGMIGGGVDDGDDSDMEKIEQEAAFIVESLYHNELLSSICEHYITNPTNNDKEIGLFVEAYFMEAIDNVASAPRHITRIKNPLEVLAKGFKIALNGLVKMSEVARDSMRRTKLKNYRRKQWIKNHGIGDLFKSGINLYLYDDNTSKMDLDTPARYVDFLYRLTRAIGESCGIKLTKEAQHRTIRNPITFKNVNEGMYKLDKVLFNKTKVVVTNNNKEILAREFFGYSDEKINVAVTHGTDQVVNDSSNIYNKLNALILITKEYAKISEAVLTELAKLEGDVNSVYYKNRPVYNKAKDNMSIVIKKYNQFINAMAHDLNTIIKLDNGLLKMTRERDIAEQNGGSWDGPDVRVNPVAPQGKQYTKKRK